MKKDIKQKVENFTKNIETKNMNTNQFIISFYRYQNGTCTFHDILSGPSFESISRVRRKLINEGKIERCNKSRDSEEEYREEFQREYNLQYNEV